MSSRFRVARQRGSWRKILLSHVLRNVFFSCVHLHTVRTNVTNRQAGKSSSVHSTTHRPRGSSEKESSLTNCTLTRYIHPVHFVVPFCSFFQRLPDSFTSLTYSFFPHTPAYIQSLFMFLSFFLSTNTMHLFTDMQTSQMLADLPLALLLSPPLPGTSQP